MGKSGFTLIEVMVALLILLIGIVAGMQLMAVAYKQAQLAQEKTLASALATSQLSQLQAISVDQLPEWLNKNANKVTSVAERNRTSCLGWVSSLNLISGSENTYQVTIHLLMSSGRVEDFTTVITEK